MENNIPSTSFFTGRGYSKAYENVMAMIPIQIFAKKSKATDVQFKKLSVKETSAYWNRCFKTYEGFWTQKVQLSLTL